MYEITGTRCGARTGRSSTAPSPCRPLRIVSGAVGRAGCGIFGTDSAGHADLVRV